MPGSRLSGSVGSVESAVLGSPSPSTSPRLPSTVMFPCSRLTAPQPKALPVVARRATAASTAAAVRATECRWGAGGSVDTA